MTLQMLGWKKSTNLVLGEIKNSYLLYCKFRLITIKQNNSN